MDTVHYFAFIFCAICVVSAVENIKSVLPLDCALVRCAAPQCDDSFTPPGKCCPVCKDRKTGFCPAPQGFGICVHECSSDYDCPDVQKCCSNGCGKVCMKPTHSGCPVNGVNYNEGATVPSQKANPCESCTCKNGSVQCEMMACVNCVGYTPPGQCCPICGSGRTDIQ